MASLSVIISGCSFGSFIFSFTTGHTDTLHSDAPRMPIRFVPHSGFRPRNAYGNQTAPESVMVRARLSREAPDSRTSLVQAWSRTGTRHVGSVTWECRA